MSAELYRRLARNADRFITACAFNAALNIAAQQIGVDPAEAKAAQRHHNNQHGRDPASVAFSEAIYLTVVHFERPQRSLARAVGISQPAISKGLRTVERRRTDPSYDRRLDEIELMLMEAAA